MAHTTLISTESLAGNLDGSWVVVDCRYDLRNESWGREQYGAAHIPGAVYASLSRDLSGPATGTNGRHPLPFGLGLHPWMPCPEDARLSAVADGVWLSGADKLPAGRSALPPAWNFCGEAPRPLPSDGVDNAFTGWDGKAQIDWPSRRLRLHISTDMGYYILYVPPGKDFFCFEPVDHPVNAHNWPGGAAANGLTVLAPGQDLRRTVRFTVEEIA